MRDGGRGEWKIGSRLSAEELSGWDWHLGNWGPKWGYPPPGRNKWGAGDTGAAGLAQGELSHLGHWSCCLSSPLPSLPECNLLKPLIKSILEVIKVSPKICSFSKLSLKKIYGQEKSRLWKVEGGQGERERMI